MHYDPVGYENPNPLIGIFPIPSVSLSPRFNAEISVLRDIMDAYHDNDLYLFDRPDFTPEYGRFVMNGYIYGARHLLHDHSDLVSDQDRAFLRTVAAMIPQYV